MSVKEVAEKLVALCRKGNIQACYNQLYSQKILSIEPENFDGMQKANGMEAVMLKLEAVAASVEKVHSTEIGDPIIAGDHFALNWKTVLTYKNADTITTINEIAVFEVENGKIIKEQFFYR
ncbi:MAG: SnoaL-like domain-containing protein [Thermonemataceae bacterium]